MLEKNKTFFLPTDPTQKCMVGKGQTKYFLIKALWPAESCSVNDQRKSSRLLTCNVIICVDIKFRNVFRFKASDKYA